MMSTCCSRRKLRQPLVAEFAGGVLDAELAGCGVLADVGATGEEQQVMLTGKFGNELFISIRIATAQLMVEVGDNEDDAQLQPEFEQDSQQRDGIRASGDGHSDAVARAQQAAFTDIVEHFFVHCLMVKQSANRVRPAESAR